LAKKHWFWPKWLLHWPIPRLGNESEQRRIRRLRRLFFTSILAFFGLMNIPWRNLMREDGCPHHKTGLQTYIGEKLTWEACGDVKGRPVECSTMTVPMDQFNATNSGDKVFTIPLIRMRGKNATQNLLLNPGGPGGSGIEFPSRRGEQLSTIVGEELHLLSFDPRGVNKSTPSATCYPDKDARRTLSLKPETRE
jgi:hypothetical protein